ncbi:hypothetical protein [Mangrovibacterium lignilyticum]|uniref:hypothetical protein n=1 Tax=Mangrovibacterium lignilyticum TaxID=2668052 RepID=UPI0013D3FC6B|nr:hypothetical protein [Mangrovibacterium lignilyticum]
MTPLLNHPTLKSIRIIYSILIVGLVFFSCMSFFITHTSGAIGDFDESTTNMLLIFANTLPIIAIPGGIFIARKRLVGIETVTLKEKLAQFQSAMIVRAATIEASGYLFLVCFALTGSIIFFFEAIAIITLQLYFFPNNTRLANEMKHDLREL